MSIEASNTVWKLSKSKGAARLVILCIANHINKDGVAWPTIGTIAEYTQVSERQVSRAIAQLEQDGEIEIVEKGDGRGRSTVYKITIKDDTMSPFKTKEEQIKDDMVSVKDDISSKKGDTMSVKGDTMSSQSLESLNNHNESLDATQMISRHFCELFAVQPGKSNWSMFWEVPITTWLKDSSADVVINRLNQAHKIAMGENEQGKIYSIPYPKSLMSIMATIKYSNGNGHANGNGVDVWRKVIDAVSQKTFKGLTDKEIAAVKAVGIDKIIERSNFTESRLKADFFKALQGS